MNRRGNEMKTIKLGCSMSIGGCKKEEEYPLSDFIDLEDWEKMSEDERQKFLDEQSEIFAWENIDNWAVVEGEGQIAHQNT
jgi:hypothetical protein